VTMPAGLPPPRPDQGFAPSGAPMAPGSQNPVVRAKQVIVFGPSGQVVGIFVYAVGTTPAAGNAPVDSITRSGSDPFGNPTQDDFVAYGAGGAFAQLSDGALNFQGAAGQFAPATVQTADLAGLLDLLSGQVTGADIPAELSLQSAAVSGVGHEQIIMGAAETVFNGTITAAGSTINVGSGTINIATGAVNLNMAVPTNFPTAGKTLAQTQACLDALITSMINRALIT